MAEVEVQLEGQRIHAIRKMTKKEVEDFFGEDMGGERSVVIVLENGVKLIASQDYEGNGCGAIFGMQGKTSFTLG